MGKPSPFPTAAQFHRFCEYARAEGFPVEKMGVAVDGRRIALLPKGVSLDDVFGEGEPNEWDAVLPGSR